MAQSGVSTLDSAVNIVYDTGIGGPKLTAFIVSNPFMVSDHVCSRVPRSSILSRLGEPHVHVQAFKKFQSSFKFKVLQGYLHE